MSAHGDRLALVACLWLVVAACLFVARRQSPLNLFVMVCVSTALVGTFFPLMSSWVRPSSWRNVVDVPEKLLNAVQLEYAAFGAGLLVAALALRATGRIPARPGVVPVTAGARVRHRDHCVSFALLAAGALLYALYVERVGIATLTSRDDYAEKYLASQGLGPLAFGLHLMIAACLWGEASDVSRGVKWSFRTVAIAIAVWSIAFISVRTNFVVLCLGYAWILCRTRRIELARVRILPVVLLLAVWAGLEGFSLYRGVARSGTTLHALETLVHDPGNCLASMVGGSELSHPFLTTVEVVATRRAGELGGKSYVDAWPAFLPVAIVPDRPVTLSEEFVRAQYGDLAERGGGAAFSVVAEAWLDFGSILGPLLAGLVVGALLLCIERCARVSPCGTWSRLAPYFVYLVVIAQRSESAIFVKQSLSILIPVFALECAADLVWTTRASNARARAPRPGGRQVLSP